MRRISEDYQGSTNWETWNVKVWMDNEVETQEYARSLVTDSKDDNEAAARLRDWAIQAYIGAHNNDAIEDAYDWNSIPEEERIDHELESMKERSPEHEEVFNDIFGQGDVKDVEPTLVDPEMVNWLELVQGIKNSLAENHEWEFNLQKGKELGIDFMHQHGSDPDQPKNRMYDAWMRHHNALSDSEIEAQGGKTWDHPQAENKLMMWNPIEAIKAGGSEYGWPHGFGDKHAQEVEQNGGWDERVSAVGRQAVIDALYGRDNPYHPKLREAMQARGYSPEEIEQMMQPQFYHDEYSDRYLPLDQTPKPVDPSLDQAGDLTLPDDWHTSSSDSDGWDTIFAQDMQSMKRHDPDQYYETRRPFLVGYDDEQDPSPAVWIGDTGDFHHEAEISHPVQQKAKRFFGEIWENTSPPVFRNADGSGTFDSYAIPHAERQYYQQQPQQKRSVADPLQPTGYERIPFLITPAGVEMGWAGEGHADMESVGGGWDNLWPQGEVKLFTGYEPVVMLPAAMEGTQQGQQVEAEVRKALGERTSSDGADYWTRSQDDWWGQENSSLFNVNVPGEAPGMARNMETDSLHCPHCKGPMHGLKCPSCGFEKTADVSVRYALPSQLEPYLEHAGDINDEELGEEPGSYLQGMAQAGIYATEDDPIVLGIEPGNPPTASIYDGNHRLLLALDEPNTPVPYVVKWIDFSTYPGDPYSGELGWPDERQAKAHFQQWFSKTALVDLGQGACPQCGKQTQNGRCVTQGCTYNVSTPGQIKMPAQPSLDGWGDAQYDSDTFLDHRMINQHLKTQEQATQYREFAERQKRQQENAWPSMGVREARISAVTRKQLLEQAAAYQHPDTSEVVHEWPDGWSVRKPTTYADIDRAGKLMGNCWDLDFVHKEEHPGPYDDHPDWPWYTSEQSGERYPNDLIDQGQFEKINANLAQPISHDSTRRVLVDPHGLPHVVWASWPHEDKTVIDNALGRHNSQPKPEYIDRLEDFARAQGKPYRVEVEDQTPAEPVPFGEPGGLSGVSYEGRPPIVREAADNVPGAPVSDSGHWVWLDGKVGFGGTHADIAESLAHELGYEKPDAAYISNWLARGHCPEDKAVAVGTLKNNKPFIWNSTRDRNHVWDAVMEAHETRT